MAGARRVGEAEVEERPPRRPAFGLEQRVIDPGLRTLGVGGFGNDVEVAGKDERRLVLEEAWRARPHALHPGELVGEFLGADRIAVRQVERDDADHAVAERHQRFDPA